MEQELPTLPEHLSSPPVLSGVHVTRYLVLCVCFVDRWLPFCTFSFFHCVVCSSSIYGFWLSSNSSYTFTCLSSCCNVWIVMKRKFKQWWSTILQIATKRTITSRLNSPNTAKRPRHIRHMTLEIRVLIWVRHRNAARLNRLNGSQSSFLDN